MCGGVIPDGGGVGGGEIVFLGLFAPVLVFFRIFRTIAKHVFLFHYVFVMLFRVTFRRCIPLVIRERRILSIIYDIPEHIPDRILD